MLYKKNRGKELSAELFRNPTAEYRGTPFWAWNCKLDRDQVLRQIDYFKEMGFGGFHMHVRTGMATPYLSEEFMGHIKVCVEKAKEQEMLAWLYDEDRWPSGAAGGFVTREKKFRMKSLCFSMAMPADALPKEEAYANGKPYYLASYDVELEPESGMLKNYRRIGRDEKASCRKWNAFVRVEPDTPWYNNQSYLDTMDEEALQKFIDVTYNAYQRAVGKDFDGAVPAIFTDEPNIAARARNYLDYALSEQEIGLPWSRYFEERYLEKYGADLLDKLPELFWITEDRRDTETKYRYYDFCAERFAVCFADQCGAWCEEHGLALTGHVLREPTLEDQVMATGDNMRQYRSFTIPGIDMLCDRVELTTAKQCQSVVHQMGKEAMLSELYGVTNWDFDFRGHKFQGDWQAALGVTVRVPHLSWMSMAGEAKRDYPASIFYQSAWYQEYPYIENHFARLNTALTRGTPIVRVGLIHPVESFWIQCGPNDQTGQERRALDQNFLSVTRWLLEGHQDFNFINESLLPSLVEEGAPCKVGQMEYDAIVVPDCVTLRTTTIAYLQAFQKAGGKVIFMGSCPAFVDGKKSGGARELFLQSEQISFNQSALSAALEPFRMVDIRKESGMPADKHLYQLRRDGEDLWLFIARFQRESTPSHALQDRQTERTLGEPTRIVIRGTYEPHLYDTLNGRVLPVSFRHEGGNTVVMDALFESDSLLLRFSAPHYQEFIQKPADPFVIGRIHYKRTIPYQLTEPNVLLLDQAEYQLDDGTFQTREEILRLDNQLRDQLGYPSRREKFAQPWVIPEEPISHHVTLRFTVHSAIKVKEAYLALEDAKSAEITWNGKPVETRAVGWYVDEAIQKVALPGIKKGTSVLTVRLPFGKRTNLEDCYILGDFGIEVQGTECLIVERKEALGLGDLTRQGLPFYGGALTYCFPVEVPVECNVEVHLGKYKGALCKVALDEEPSRPVAFEPFDTTFQKVPKGRHTLKITLFGHRFNTFGCVHNCADRYDWFGPDSWRTLGDSWCYEYRLKEMGLLTSPRILLYK